MNPKLIAIAGPLRGSTISLDCEELPLGRDASKPLFVADQAVSRRHCVFRRDVKGVRVVDAGSSNGTFVNGVPIGDRLLEHGDEIRVGSSLFQVVLDDADALPASRDAEAANRTFVADPARHQIARTPLYLDPDKLFEILPGARIARDLSALLKISTVINSIKAPDALQRKLLDLIFEVVPSDRGALVLSDRRGVFSTIAMGNGGAEGRGPFEVSPAIVERVLHGGTTFTRNGGSDIPVDGVTRPAGVESILAAPLVVFERTIGVLYLDILRRGVEFSEDDVQFLTAVAGIAAVAIDNARHVQWLVGEKHRLESEIDLEHHMVGESNALVDVHRLIARVAPTDSTVLISGESGTGKELAARSIHRNSPRADRPFVAINCATLADALLESDLFGHEKGAFTGAFSQKRGKLEVADGGTLFLDEVGELTPPIQAKLLRVLQEREFERVGGTRPVKVNIRIVAATNRSLEEQVRAGAFRADLFYRLNVIRLTMPPLRERPTDIALLASYFLAKYAEKCGRRVLGISEEARTRLLTYDWPGNVRELENTIERAVVLGGADQIMPEDLPDIMPVPAAADGASTRFENAVREAKRQIVKTAFAQAGGNHNAAARALGIHPNNLHRLIRTLDLKQSLKN